MSRTLRRKLRRDIWRHRWQFLAVSLVIAIGIAVYVAASDAYANLQQSFDRAYAEQRLPDAVISGPGAAALAPAAASLPGHPIVAVRTVGDTGLRIDGHGLVGRVVGVPDGRQPEVSSLALRSGGLASAGSVVVEQHIADFHGLQPGDRILGSHPSTTARMDQVRRAVSDVRSGRTR